jgi:hypothetical protein
MIHRPTTRRLIAADMPAPMATTRLKQDTRQQLARAVTTRPPDAAALQQDEQPVIPAAGNIHDSGIEISTTS